MPRFRDRNFVRMGSLSAASRRDSRATDSGTPSSSNRMLPGRTVATQYSGAPLPLPMRVSGGREVTDLSGKMRIQSLPLRFMFRVSATRAASIWVLVIKRDPASEERIRRSRWIYCVKLSCAAAALGFTILHSFWHQWHDLFSLINGFVMAEELALREPQHRARAFLQAVARSFLRVYRAST